MRIAPFLLATLLAACAGPGDAGDPQAPPEEPSQRSVAGSPATPGVTPGVALSVILDESPGAAALPERMDEPLRVERKAIPNRHVPGQTDTLRTYVYDGLALEFYEVTGGGPLLQTVEVTADGYETAEGLGVGSTRAELEAVYTHPTGAEGRIVSYERTGSPEDPTPLTLDVRYDGDRVAALTWHFYVD